MALRYRVTLTKQERQYLLALTRNGKTGAKVFIHARALLLCDTGSDDTTCLRCGGTTAVQLPALFLNYNSTFYTLSLVDIYSKLRHNHGK